LGGNTLRRSSRAPKKEKTCHVTAAGKSFLEAATSAPDFLNGACQGVPDQYSGKSVVMNDYHLEATTFNAGTDTYLLFSPIPGQAFARSDKLTSIPLENGDVFQSKPFKDTSQLFPSIGTDIVAFSDNTAFVDKFRYVSLAAEIQCTSNDMTWAGNIELIKAPVALAKEKHLMAASPSGPAAFIDGTVMTGLDSIRNFSQVYSNGYYNAEGNVHAAPFKDGVYSCSLNKDPTWGFIDVTDGTSSNDQVYAPISTQAVSGTQDRFLYSGSVVGIGSCDTIMMRVSVPAGGPSMSAFIKVWHTVEYQPVYGTLLSTIATPSPAYDECALALYQVFYKNLPLAVPSRENANFWKRVLGLIKSVAGTLTVLPGAYGQIAQGVLAGAELIPT